MYNELYNGWHGEYIIFNKRFIKISPRLIIDNDRYHIILYSKLIYRKVFIILCEKLGYYIANNIFELSSVKLSKDQIRKRRQEILKLRYKKYNIKLVNDIIYDRNNGITYLDGCGILLFKKSAERDNNTYILLRYINNIYYIPKGNRKINETNYEGAKRELFRYTNIDSNEYDILDKNIIIKYNQYYKSYRGDICKTLYLYPCYIIDVYRNNKIVDNEYGSYHWIHIFNLPKIECEKNLNILYDNIMYFSLLL